MKNMNLKKILAIIAVVVMAFVSNTAQAQSLSASTKWHWDGGTIVVDTPERAEGQEHAVGLAVAPIKNLRVAFVGLGMRGPWAVWPFLPFEGVKLALVLLIAPPVRRRLIRAGLLK